ncbi:hypothetical protein A2108_02265 [Candidatus Wolfebacteria bacterium GWA1_42_9]|nr:MAG: hypothetical protein A2108_02265 [Candidatus Wolfebacteria bacterium GWA1_42_9]
MTLRDLAVRKNRSALTILGIVIGITSIMVVMSVGKGAQEYVLGEIQRFGPNNVFILPGKEPSGPTGAMGTLLNDSLKERDIDDLSSKSNVPQAVSVIPYVFGSVSLSVGQEIERSMIIGSTVGSQKNFDLKLAEGRFFDEFDLNDKARVVIIGDEIRKKLFENSEAVGQKINIKNLDFQIIGVLAQKSKGSFIDFNDSLIAPYTAIQQDILGIRHFQRVAVEAQSEESIPTVVADIKMTLRENHKIEDPEDDDFNIQTQEDIAKTVGTITGILTVLLFSVAAISLVVGGVGIMNIMLVSVTERTREIGLRKSIGATNKNILTQFLAEALFLTISGGIIGVLLGTSLTYLGIYFVQEFAQIDFPFTFSFNGAVIGILVSSFIGLAFGVFPARQASRKSPVEALRYE